MNLKGLGFSPILIFMDKLILHLGFDGSFYRFFFCEELEFPKNIFSFVHGNDLRALVLGSLCILHRILVFCMILVL